MLSGGPGVAMMLGGTGNDTYTVANALDVVTENVGEGIDKVVASVSYTLTAGSEIEVLSGSGVAGLTLTGNEFANTIIGTAGKDTLSGGGGIDTYDLSQTTAAATVSLAAGTATSPQIGTDTLASIENVTGGSGNDNITGDASGNNLSGGAGNDTLNGGAGADTLNGDDGNDRFVATVDDGNDTYDGGLGTDTYDLSATAADATINLGLGISTSTATGTDLLISIENVIGSSGNDTFVAAVGDGNNSYNGGTGTDTYDLSATTAAATVNLAVGTASSLDIGADTLTLNTIENVTGGPGNDTLTGNAQNNILIGGAGNDTLNGGAGDDTMLGGARQRHLHRRQCRRLGDRNRRRRHRTVNASVNYTLAALSQVEILNGTERGGPDAHGQRVRQHGEWRRRQ